MPKLKLSLERLEGENYIRIQVLDPGRFETFGFGSFMLDISDREISITSRARAALLRGCERNGIQAMEFWPDRRLAWGSTNDVFLAPLDAINVPDGAKEWIRRLGEGTEEEKGKGGKHASWCLNDMKAGMRCHCGKG